MTKMLSMYNMTMAVLVLLGVCLAVSAICRLPGGDSASADSGCPCRGLNLEEDGASGTQCSNRKVLRFQSHGTDAYLWHLLTSLSWESVAVISDLSENIDTLLSSHVDESCFTQLEICLVDTSSIFTNPLTSPNPIYTSHDLKVQSSSSNSVRMYTPMYFITTNPPLNTSVQPTSTTLLATFRRLQSKNILISGSKQFQMDALQQMETLSKEDGLSSLVLNTKWLLILDSPLVKHASITSMRLNNLLVLSRHTKSSFVTPLTLVRSLEQHDLVCVRNTTVSRGATPSVLFPNEKSGLLGRHIRVGVYLWYAYTIATIHNGTTVYTGLCNDILDIMAEALNFSYRLVLPPDGEWGDLRDGQWTGLMGLVERQEVDVVVAALNLLDSRLAVMDCTRLPFHSEAYGLAFVETDPPQLLALWSSFLSPFSWQVYVSVAVSFPCSLAFLWFVQRLEVTTRDHHDNIQRLEVTARDHHDDESFEHATSLSNTALFLFGASLSKADGSAILVEIRSVMD